METKICGKCKIPKPLNEYHKDKTQKDGLNYKCKSCKKVHGDEYRKNNPDKIIALNKKYYENNKDYFQSEERKEYKKQYNEVEENKVKIKKYLKGYMLEYFRNKRKNDPNHRIKDALTTRIFGALKNGHKSKRTLELVGCSIKEFRQYIQSLFKPEMNWENWGSLWELDHIIGCCNFDLSKPEEQEKCFHYTNLQPLFKTSKIAEQHGYKDIKGNRNKPKRTI